MAYLVTAVGEHVYHRVELSFCFSVAVRVFTQEFGIKVPEIQSVMNNCI